MENVIVGARGTKKCVEDYGRHKELWEKAVPGARGTGPAARVDVEDASALRLAVAEAPLQFFGRRVQFLIREVPLKVVQPHPEVPTQRRCQIEFVKGWGCGVTG